MNLLANTIKQLLAKKENFNKVDLIVLILDINENSAVGKIKGERAGSAVEVKMSEGSFPEAVINNFFFQRWLKKIKEETSQLCNIVLIHLDFTKNDFYLEARWTDLDGQKLNKKFDL